MENITCYDKWSSSALRIDATMICATSQTGGNQSTCSGDSGGPLSIEQGGKFVQIGVTSFGSDDCLFPSVFSRITYSLEWISAAISSSSQIGF